jgi:hypothetical protein
VQGLLMNLNQEIEQGRREYLSKKQAYKRLKELTGQDLGYDVEQWRTWFKNNPNPLIRPKKSAESPDDRTLHSQNQREEGNTNESSK